MILEVCANSYESAVNAENAGAHRVELCEKLNCGGITPNYNLAKKVISRLNIPVYVLISPELETSIIQIKNLKKLKRI